MKSGFEVLKNKEIIEILDGDKVFGEYIDTMNTYGNSKKIEVCMPYLSGPNIRDISKLFGLNQSSLEGISRWQYFDRLLDYCIDRQKTSDFLTYLFAKERFVDKLRGLPPEKIDEVHTRIVQEIIQQINSILYFGNNELCLTETNYVIRAVGTSINIDTPSVKIIDRYTLKISRKEQSKKLTMDILIVQ